MRGAQPRRRRPAASGTRRTRRGPRSTGPPLLRTQCSTSTALRALARIGVPTDSASSASSDRLSYGDGQTTTVAASSACSRSRSDSRPAKRMNGSSGSDISFDAHQRQRRVAAFLHVAAEVLESALRSPCPDRCGRRTARSGRTAGGGGGRPRRARSRCDGKSRAGAVLVGRRRSVGVSGRRSAAAARRRRRRRHARVRLLLRQVDADADDFLEQRPIGKLQLRRSAARSRSGSRAPPAC